MIEEIVKERMEVVGLTQAKLSTIIGCTPTQLSLFLKGEASLNRRALDKCFEVLGMKLCAISKRIALAKKVATKLQSYSLEDVISMNRDTMIGRTGFEEIRGLPEVSKQEFDMMLSSEIGDYEATFQYFKTLVLHFMKVHDGFSPKKVENSLNALAGLLITVPLIPVFGIGSLIGVAVGTLAATNSALSRTVNNAWGSLTTLTISLFK